MNQGVRSSRLSSLSVARRGEIRETGKTYNYSHFRANGDTGLRGEALLYYKTPTGATNVSNSTATKNPFEDYPCGIQLNRRGRKEISYADIYTREKNAARFSRGV